MGSQSPCLTAWRWRIVQDIISYSLFFHKEGSTFPLLRRLCAAFCNLQFVKNQLLGLLSAALLCCALPSAFAAEDKDSQVYTIGLDAMGGSSSAVAVTTNLSGKLSALPAQPTLEGYTFDGWYTEPVGGTKISTSTVFTGDTTVYAHWTVKNATTSTSTSTPAQPEQTAQEYDDGPILSVLTVAGALITTLAVAAFI